MKLVESIYASTAKYPQSEQYGLVTQMRRAAVSVPSNIAEGFARSGSKELLYFLSIASGSLSELDTLVDLANRLSYERDPEPLQSQIDDVAGQVMGLSASIKRES
jgi:four helix bundle protein